MPQVLCPVLVRRDEMPLGCGLPWWRPRRAAAALCGGRACTTWFVLTYLLGRDHVRVYDGLWAE